MFLKNPRLHLVVSVLLPLLMTVIAQAQQSGRNRPSMRDQVRAITRAEMDRQLLLNATLPANHDAEVARQAVLKQIREDFSELQALNNKMMAEAWAKPALNYSFVSNMITRIRGKASRLKLNLNLPQPEATDKPVSNKPIGNSGDFRAALMVLDRTIMSFVSNPIFQKPNMIEIKQGTDARRDLETVIDLTEDLRKTALRLKKEPHSQ